MGTFKQLQVEKARQPPVVAQEPGPTLIEQVGSFIDTLMFQVDVASTVYIAYAAVCMFFNAPLKLFNTPLSVRLRRTAFRVPKVPFIVVVVFLWWAYSYLLVTISSPEVALYLHNVQTDACFIQPAFYAERNAAIVKSCRTLVNLQTNFTHNLGAITDIANGLSFCNTQCGTAAAASTAFCNGVPRVNFNVLYSSAVAYNTSWHRVSRVPGFGRCDDTIELRSRYLRAPESSVSADFWLQSGLVAQILIKFLLSNFVLAALHTVDPLSESGGVYESDSTVDLKANGRLCAEVHTMLRLQQLRGLAWWSCLSALALANLVYAAAMGPAPTAWDLPSVVVVAAAASVVCAIVCYIFRAQLKVCCTRSARACMACCLRCAVATRNCRCCTKK